MYGNCGNVSDGFHVPDLPEKFFFGKYVVWIFRQKGKQIKFFCGKVFLFAVYPDSSGRFVNLDAANLNDIVLAALEPTSRSYLAIWAFTLATSSLGLKGLVM